MLIVTNADFLSFKLKVEVFEVSSFGRERYNSCLSRPWRVE